MKDIHEIRKDNFLELLRRLNPDIRKATAIMADRLGKSQPLIGQWKSDTTDKNIGDRAAREIEQAFGLEYGWMDNIHHNGPSYPKIIVDTMVCLEEAITEERLKISAQRKAELLLAFAEFFSPDHPPTKAHILRLLRPLL